MDINIAITRRTAVVATATLLAVGGAVVIGLTGNSSAPRANAGAYPAAVSETGMAADAFPGITVQGVGKVTGTPDTLILTLGVSKTAPDVGAAMNGITADMNAVENSLKGSHVAEADMKTSGLNVGPECDYSAGKCRITGYQAAESLTVTLRDIKSAGATISAAAAAGGNDTQISGLSTDLQNNGPLMDQARGAAFADAKAKADQYAKAAGQKLGGVVRVEETVSQQPYGFADSMGGAPSAAKSIAPVNIQVGSTDVSVSVTVVFAFG